MATPSVFPMFLKAQDGGVGDRIVDNVDFLLVTPIVDLVLSAIDVTLTLLPLVPMDVVADINAIELELDGSIVLTVDDNIIGVEICDD